MGTFQERSIPKGFEKLSELAMDLRWTWSHAGDRLWNTINAEVWEQTQNPWLMIQSMSRVELAKLSRTAKFRDEFQRLIAVREEHMNRKGWFREKFSEDSLNRVAYFSMEFGLGEALPLYAGGLGILAGDYLKTACDLMVPLVGVGLLYQEGYFRQAIDTSGKQLEAYPYNDPISLPISRVTDAADGWLRIPLELPGRTLWLRVWQAQAGVVPLYLLDSNDPLNHPFDRGITNNLYPERPEIRLMQEMVLGIGGWRVIESLGLKPEICHLNEGHTAFAIIERARDFMKKTKEPFPVALCATRAGNVFTTHTPVAAGFDNFPPELVAHYLRDYLDAAGISPEQILSLGRKNNQNHDDTFNMAYLAMRGSINVNGVSRLHGQVSRRIFQTIYPRWPEAEIPVHHITNGVHMPSWDSQGADELWTKAFGKERWLHTLEHLSDAIQSIPDVELWALRTGTCQSLVNYVRRRLVYQLRQEGAKPERIRETELVLDTGVLTIGFARRFTAYKRPNLLLTDAERLAAIITNPKFPVQLIVAGKAHPYDEEGKQLVQQFVKFSERPDVLRRVVFLEDYDIAVAQQLVQGVDLWLNTPMRPWEACGTSGMKVLVNGGLNISELDGWWAEAYSPEVGWALGDGQEHTEDGWDMVEANQFYELMEKEIVPEFYKRDARGVPLGWVARVRASLSKLAINFSSNRMLREYVENVYIPTAKLYRQRIEANGLLAKKILAWQNELAQHWAGIRLGEVAVSRLHDRWRFTVAAYLGECSPGFVSVEIYANPVKDETPVRIEMERGDKIAGESNTYTYQGEAPISRPAEHYTVRIIPCNSDAVIPLEGAHIFWQK